MTKRVCPCCGWKLGNAPGIGDICINRDCPVNDDADVWGKSKREVAEIMAKSIEK